MASSHIFPLGGRPSCFIIPPTETLLWNHLKMNNEGRLVVCLRTFYIVFLHRLNEIKMLSIFPSYHIRFASDERTSLLMTSVRYITYWCNTLHEVLDPVQSKVIRITTENYAAFIMWCRGTFKEFHGFLIRKCSLICHGNDFHFKGRNFINLSRKFVWCFCRKEIHAL